MTIDSTLWLWLGAGGMAAGTLPALYRLVTDPENRVYAAVLSAVTGIAAVAYVLMALGYGVVTVGGDALEVVRYADWLATTPLMVLYLGFLARPGRRVLWLLVAVDVVVVVSGAAAAVSPGVWRFVLFGLGSFAYLVLVGLLVWTLPRRASFESARVAAAFVTLRNLTVVVWTLYPVIWLLAPTGVGLLLPETRVLVMSYLDLVAKVGFVVVAVRAMDAMTDVDTAALSTAD
jgi:sensory rhodopsin